MKGKLKGSIMMILLLSNLILAYSAYTNSVYAQIEIKEDVPYKNLLLKYAGKILRWDKAITEPTDLYTDILVLEVSDGIVTVNEAISVPALGFMQNRRASYDLTSGYILPQPPDAGPPPIMNQMHGYPSAYLMLPPWWFPYDLSKLSVGDEIPAFNHTGEILNLRVESVDAQISVPAGTFTCIQSLLNITDINLGVILYWDVETGITTRIMGWIKNMTEGATSPIREVELTLESVTTLIPRPAPYGGLSAQYIGSILWNATVPSPLRINMTVSRYTVKGVMVNSTWTTPNWNLTYAVIYDKSTNLTTLEDINRGWQDLIHRVFIQHIGQPMIVRSLWWGPMEGVVGEEIPVILLENGTWLNLTIFDTDFQLGPHKAVASSMNGTVDQVYFEFTIGWSKDTGLTVGFALNILNKVTGSMFKIMALLKETTVLPDETPPLILDVTQTPKPEEVKADEDVKVSAVVVESGVIQSGIKNVTLRYSTDNGQTWERIRMTYKGDDLYEGVIPGQKPGTRVIFLVEAFDESSNQKSSSQLSYAIPAEFPWTYIIIGIIIIAIAVAVALLRLRRR